MKSNEKDYILLSDSNKYKVYEVHNAEGAVYLGKYTTWCIAKRKTFFPDTAYRKQEGGKTFIIESLLEKNSVEKYSDQHEYYCITTMPDGSIDEMVNSNNENMLYTDREDEMYSLVKDYI